jgi:Uncharacterised nucleotidyltransferase
VLACARVAASREDIAAIAAGPVDWDAAVRLGIRHGLGPLMHRHLSRFEMPVPKPAAAALWARAQLVAERNGRRIAELVAIARDLHAQGVPFLPFKGPALAARAYGDVSLREFNDLDLLVAPADVPQARRILEKRGYSPRTALDAVRDELWMRSGSCYELPLANERGDLVELQWRANPDVGIPPTEEPGWWASAQTHRFEGVDICVMAREEEMLALLVHGSKHSWASIDWLVDVAELTRTPGFPWQRLMALARDHAAERRAALGLRLAHDLLELPLPDEVAGFARRARIDAVASGIVASLLKSRYVQPSPIRVLRAELALCDSWSRRVARIAGLARPTPGDWQWTRLPRRLAFLYWVLRPARLALKYLFIRFPRTRAAATPRTPPPRPHSTG